MSSNDVRSPKEHVSLENTDIATLEQKTAEELVQFALSTFGMRAAIGTSFQHTGLVLIDMAKRAGLPFRVFTIDTLRLHDETYRHIDAVEKHFGIQVERRQPDANEVQKMVQRHGEFLFFDSPEKRQYCCKIRKDVPNSKVMEGVDCWLSGLRRDQSEERESTPKATITDKFDHYVLKLSPLADWSEAQTKSYLEERNIPINPLFSQGYTSIGCVICTTPILKWESARAGRWRWEKAGVSKECGIHVEQGGGI